MTKRRSVAAFPGQVDADKIFIPIPVAKLLDKFMG